MMWLFLDFDGTISQEDLCDALLQRFADGPWMAAGRAWTAGNIDAARMHSLFCKFLSANLGELRSYAQDIARARPGFREFVTAALKQDHRICVISSGWDVYILALLTSPEFRLVRSPDELFAYVASGCRQPLAVANEVVEGPSGLSLSENFMGPWCCCNSIPCKQAVIRFLRRSAPDIEAIGIGDGRSDLCMADEVDHMFAMAPLTGMLRRVGKPYRPFSSFAELRRTVLGA